jgi:O-antigen ligase
MGARQDHLSEKYVFRLNQAHNGYLETYLNGGVFGLCLLVVLIVVASKNLRLEILQGLTGAQLRFALFLVALFHNWTEATFNKMGALWFVFLWAIMTYPAHSASFEPDSTGTECSSETLEDSPV